MPEPARSLVVDTGRPLRVAIVAAPLQMRQWTRLVEELGHRATTAEDADVILADRGSPFGRGSPVVRIGESGLGADGRLAAEATPEQIDAALRAAAAGLRVASPELGEPVLRPLADLVEKSLLTPREVEVLAALSEGLTNKAIARRFGISLHTVKFHLESVFRKLGVRTRSEATARWLKRAREDTITI